MPGEYCVPFWIVKNKQKKKSKQYPVSCHTYDIDIHRMIVDIKYFPIVRRFSC